MTQIQEDKSLNLPNQTNSDKQHLLAVFTQCLSAYIDLHTENTVNRDKKYVSMNCLFKIEQWYE